MADTKKALNCPACGKEMNKIQLQDYNFCVDICLDGCGSIVFDNREFQKFDEKSENIDPILKAYQGKEFPEADTKEDLLLCPVCNSKMVKNNAGPMCDCKIDECYACGAKFLNYNELLKIREKAGENNAEYEKALRMVIAEKEKLERQNAGNKTLYKSFCNLSEKFFKKH